MNQWEHQAYRAGVRMAVDSLSQERGLDRKTLSKKMGSREKWLSDQLYRGMDLVTAVRACKAMEIGLNEFWARVEEEKQKFIEMNQKYVCRGTPEQIGCGHSYEDHQTSSGHCKACKYPPCERWNPQSKE